MTVEELIFCAALAAFVLFVFVQGYLNEKKENKKFAQKLENLPGNKPDKEYKIERFLRISAYFEKHSKDFQIDDITWNDLDMDDLFKRMNYCLSSTGEEYLYYMLRTPEFEEEKLTHLDEVIEYYASNPKERVAFQILMKKLGTTGKFSLYDYIDYLHQLPIRSNAKEFLQILLVFVGIICMCVQLSAGILLIVAWMLFQIFDYYKKKGEIEAYTVSLAYIIRMLEISDKVEAVLPDVCDKERAAITDATKKLKKTRHGAFWLFNSGNSKTSGNPLDVIFDYLRMIFHLDLIAFYHMLGTFVHQHEDIDVLVTNVGYLESAISIGLYRASLNNGYCKPDFSYDGMDVVEGYHPMIDKPVKNSICEKGGVLLTGSNASGKSTFLKMLAINALMAQTIYTVTASKYNSAFCCLYSSMSLRDDLENEESYFIVEIKSLKRILDQYGKNKIKILCFVDEVLRGTNTVERIAASTQILESMNGVGIQCFAATHDIELTHLLEEHYANYHFEEEIKDGDVLFNYQLMKGRATTRNAIKLLEIIGYQEDVIQRARTQADIFLSEGIWKRP